MGEGAKVGVGERDGTNVAVDPVGDAGGVGAPKTGEAGGLGAKIAGSKSTFGGVMGLPHAACTSYHTCAASWNWSKSSKIGL